MIVSASRRTDIPAYYSEWMMNRLREGYVLVRNPMNARQVSRVSLSPDVVDGIVFWTKNPAPMVKRLPGLEPWHYYFHVTVTPYGRGAEAGLPLKDQVIIPAFQELSRRIGRKRTLWRYDPIFFSGRYTPEYHKRAFEALAGRLGEYAELCTVSFLDYYRNTEKNMKPLGIWRDTEELRYELMESFSETAKRYGFSIAACAEDMELESLGIRRGSCIDKGRFEQMGNCRLNIKKDPGQRRDCGCAQSIDIGAYNTCAGGCLYCYANHSHKTVIKNMGLHHPDSPLLVGEPGPGDVIKERQAVSCKDRQMTVFDFMEGKK